MPGDYTDFLKGLLVGILLGVLLLKVIRQTRNK
jgi:hypothetical protein